jgi:hypothetical protein
LLVLLIMATIVDAALAILLVAVSGFIFGGPEGVNGEPTAVALWVVALAGCFAAPAAGFALRSQGRPGYGALAALIPPAVGALFIGF